MAGAPFRPARVGGCLEAAREDRADGTVLLRSTEALGWHPERLSDLLDQWAQSAADRTFVARRAAGGGDWIRISYAQMRERARSIGQALLEAGLSAERPLAILSDNDLEHASLMMAAQWVGVPTISVSAAYSLLSTDYGKLRHILGTTTPGMVYAADARFAKAIAAAVAADVQVVMGAGAVEGRATRRFDDLLATPATPAVDAARAATGPDTIAKFLFTSGSTKQPKGVITTHRMLCANQQMLHQCMAFLRDEPPVLVDWLPWSHTFGGNHNFGIALYNGGTLYIDDGKPTPKGIAETIRNLTELSPTVYFNVPKGLEEIANAMDRDVALRDALFKRCNAFMFAAAGLSQAVWDKLDAHGVAATGERVRIMTGLGMTETAPSCLFLVGTHARSGTIGLPCPGVEVKLVPNAEDSGKTEIRFRGPNVMPGYWRDAAQTAAAFDEEGFYRTGDAVTFVDESRLELGLMFDGRIAEDFKLSTGTFVSVGPLRAKIIALGDPCVQDAVIAGLNRDELAALVFPRLADCARLAGLPADAAPTEVLHHPAVRAFFQALADRLWREGTGSANRVARMHVLVEPPSIDKGEITDKSSINQRAVLSHRASLVEAIYQGTAADPWLILPAKG
ncbi:feruloyl-CoA synthase [Ideonella livida]|uniref:Feruloyl-CoA synthase n=1 Tax=Ideonella livida TaxID=2707176 RepID=A0A7C9TMF3_9BURK|nr:feruloyl-CoA synthase [Ideonella livida]NDY92585.1 feruloyl-CoA synthase [Ideonella livida]